MLDDDLEEFAAETSICSDGKAWITQLNKFETMPEELLQLFNDLCMITFCHRWDKPIPSCKNLWGEAGLS